MRRKVSANTEDSYVQMTTSDDRGAGKRKLPASVEQQINENLRLLYQQQMQEGLPDHLKALVARLREGEVQGTPGSGGGSGAGSAPRTGPGTGEERG